MAFRKQWRWLGAFGPDVMLCAARAAIGPARVASWAVWDREAGVERTVWIDGEPHPVGPVEFDGLTGVGGLRFTAEAARARRDNLLVIASDYEQPFGTFSGELPIAGPLREGYGVMERHEARW
jgi:uncharacterized protein DUF2804